MSRSKMSESTDCQLSRLSRGGGGGDVVSASRARDYAGGVVHDLLDAMFLQFGATSPYSYAIKYVGQHQGFYDKLLNWAR